MQSFASIQVRHIRHTSCLQSSCLPVDPLLPECISQLSWLATVLTGVPWPRAQLSANAQGVWTAAQQGQACPSSCTLPQLHRIPQKMQVLQLHAFEGHLAAPPVPIIEHEEVLLDLCTWYPVFGLFSVCYQSMLYHTTLYRTINLPTYQHTLHTPDIVEGWQSQLH